MGALEDFTDVPLPDYLDALADTDPQRVFAKVLTASSIPYGITDLTVRDLANAVDQAARWLDVQLGSNGASQTVAFMATGQDLRYFIIMLGALKSERLAFFPSPRNDTYSHCSLFDEYRCSTLLLPRTSSLHDKMKPVIDQLCLKVVGVPGLNYFLSGSSGRYAWMPDIDDIRLQPMVAVHTSGSTDVPKPVVARHGNFTAMEHWKRVSQDYGKITFTHWAGKSVLLALPLYHLAGLNVAMAALQNHTVVILPPTGLGLVNADIVSDVLENIKADILVTSPSILANMATDTRLSKSFSLISDAAYGGGPLSKTAGDAIAAQCNLSTLIYTTECGILPSQLIDKTDWQYTQFSPVLGIEMRQYADDLHELHFVRDDAYNDFQVPFFTFPGLREYSSKDLFSPHPSKPDLWLWQGRTDDIIIYSSGEKFNPTTTENNLSLSPLVKAALVCGDGQARSALLLEPRRKSAPPLEFLEAVWPLIQNVNATCPDFARIRKDMIVVTEPRRPLPRTGKENVQRKAALALYDEELRALYPDDNRTSIHSIPTCGRSSLQRSGPVNDENPDERLWIGQILDILERLTGLQLEAEDDFLAYGLDSSGVAGLVRSLRKLVKIHGDEREVGPKTVYEHPSALLLARYLSRNEDQGLDTTSTMQKLYDKHAFNLPVSARAPTPYDVERKVVLLTGSTGSFGTYLLDMLLKDATVSQIYCLNRKHNAREIQLAALAAQGLTTDWNGKTVTFLRTDFSKQYSGLGLSVYKELLGEVTHILHNAWHVDFNLPLTSFEVPHILSIRQLIEFSSQSFHGAMIFFLSSIDAVSNYKSSNLNSTSRTIPEEPLSSWDSASESSGYGQSKLVAERLLCTAATDAEIPIAICRLGQLAGPADSDGTWNKWEWIPSLVISSKFMGCLPATLGAYDVVNWIPIDHAAKIVGDFLHDAVTKLKDNGNDGRPLVYHAVNPKTTTWEMLLPYIQPHLGVYEVVPSFEWVEQLAESEDQGSEENPAGKLLPFYRRMVESDMRVPLDTTRSQTTSKMLAEQLKPVSGEVFETWLQKWI